MAALIVFEAVLLSIPIYLARPEQLLQLRVEVHLYTYFIKLIFVTE